MLSKKTSLNKILYVLVIFVFVVTFLTVRHSESIVDASNILFDDPWCATGSCWMYRYVDIYDGCYHPPGASYCTQQYIRNTWTYCGKDEDCDYELSGKIKCYPDCSTEVVTQTGHCCLDSSSCTPSTSCSCKYPLSSSNQGNYTKKVTCDNGCDGTASSTCYCPAGSCSLLDSIWSDTQPSTTPYREYELTVPVDPTKYVDNCSKTDIKTCYTTNQYPNVENIQIVPAGDIGTTVATEDEEDTQTDDTERVAPIDEGEETLPIDGDDKVSSSISTIKNLFEKFVSKLKAADFSDEKVMGFYSTTHSGIGVDVQEGGGVNNPIGLTATYSDPDGQDDILAIYVWWNHSSIKSFTTPDKIGTGDKETTSNNNFGFMISRDEVGGTWNKVYVPGEGNIFIEAGSISEAITIYGSGGDDMIVLDNISVIDQGTNEIHLELTMEFITNTGDTVSSDNYNLWGMANDYAGFTEFEEDGNIKDSDKWGNSGTIWYLDMVKPVIDPPSTSTIGDEVNPQIRLVFTATDLKELSYVRVDACYGFDNNSPQPLTAADGSTYTMQPCDGISEYFQNDLNVKTYADLISSSPSLVGSDTFNSGDIDIGIGSNDGTITFYITAMDTSGNYQQKQVIYKLGDWAAVQDGFVFGKSGVTSSTRVLENDWDSNSEIKDSSYTNFTYDTVDVTNDVLLGGSTSDIAFLGTLEKYNINHSFKASKYSGAPVNAVYSELTMAYELKKRNISYIEKDLSTLNGTLSSYCNGAEPYDFCIIKNSGNITINSDFECDTKGLIISGGDINISPDMTNSSTSSDSACIILAKNDINIDQGDSKSGADVNYDIIQSFMIAGNDINIDGDSSNNGLLVEGGLFGFGTENGTSILNGRSIAWGFRNQYPIIVVDNNAKYGLLSKDVFGSQVEIFKLEIGFKPY